MKIVSTNFRTDNSYEDISAYNHIADLELIFNGDEDREQFMDEFNKVSKEYKEKAKNNQAETFMGTITYWNPALSEVYLSGAEEISQKHEPYVDIVLTAETEWEQFRKFFKAWAKEFNYVTLIH